MELSQQERNITAINEKWQTTINAKTSQLTATIEMLQSENSKLANKNTELELKIVKLQREVDEGDSEIVKIQMEGIKKEN